MRACLVAALWACGGLAALDVRAASVVVGNWYLSANTANQVVPIFVTGGESIGGLDFFAQIGDGGAFLGGVNVKPAFQSVDALGLFVGNNNGAFGDPNGAPAGSNAGHPLLWVDGTTTATGTVPAAGTLATLVVSTVGGGAGTFPLKLSGVAPSLGGFATGLVDGFGVAVPLSIANGTLTVLPGWTADFDENLAVNAADLAVWTNGFSSLIANHMQGDATGEATVDGADVLLWQRQLGLAPPALMATAAVPEPAAGCLVATAALAVLMLRRRDLSPRSVTGG